MDADTLFVLGVLGILLAVPAVISAFTEGRAPRVAAVLFIAGGSCLAIAFAKKPGGYSFAEVPSVFTSVISGLF